VNECGFVAGLEFTSGSSRVLWSCSIFSLSLACLITIQHGPALVVAVRSDGYRAMGEARLVVGFQVGGEDE